MELCKPLCWPLEVQRGWEVWPVQGKAVVQVGKIRAVDTVRQWDGVVVGNGGKSTSGKTGQKGEDRESGRQPRKVPRTLPWPRADELPT